MHIPPDPDERRTILEPSPRPIPQNPLREGWVVGIGGLLVALMLVLVVRPLLAQQEGLTIVQTSSNQVQITITNAVPGTVYEIHRRALFIEDPDYQWRIHLVGTNNTQTNFTAFMGVDMFGFFRAQQGTDADGDGIVDWLDGNPTNSSVSTLFITIDNPTNAVLIY